MKVKDYDIVVGAGEKVRFPNNEIYEDSTGHLHITGYTAGSGSSGTSGTSGASGVSGTSGSSGSSGVLTDPGTIGTLTVTEKVVIPTDQPTSLVNGCIWIA